MDISKLPRLSQTNAPPPVDPEAGTVAAADARPAEAGFPVMGVPAAPGPASPAVWCGRCSAPNAPGSQFCNSCGGELRPAGAVAVGYRAPVGVMPGIGAEVWISAIIGLVLMLLGRSFASWALATLTGGTFHTNVNWTAGPNAGTEVGYWDLQGFTALQDTALFLFGLAMVLEAIVLAVVHSPVRAKRPLLMFALAVTVLATVLNLLVSFKLIAAGIIPFMSLLAVGFGGYIAAYEWRLLQYFRPAAPVAQRA